MPKYVFHYFNMNGLGESVRILLAYGGEGFEDHRVNAEDWPAFKPSKLWLYYIFRETYYIIMFFGLFA